MSAGLMSCVRENSPPLECPPAASSDGISHSSGGGGGPPGTMAGPGHGSMMLDPNDMPITITTPEHLQHLQHHHQHHQQEGRPCIIITIAVTNHFNESVIEIS
ncbi:hypothetical protein pipiens_013471 [Culex pipiens pipiens]|uniref:Uncharacterized protein n=1 Tax=Culex pipiens pipiens TaxID=38569 RepID=A0ABD1CYD1_CULPP